jgi:hypothetical protein
MRQMWDGGDPLLQKKFLASTKIRFLSEFTAGKCFV